jgi:hypothetical protein
VRLPRGDLLLDLCRPLGIEATPSQIEGTMLVLDFGRLMHKLLPYLHERFPGWSGQALHTAVGGGRHTAWTDDGFLQFDGDPAVLWGLFGSLPGREGEGMHAEGLLAQVVERCLPLPLPTIYLNMI